MYNLYNRTKMNRENTTTTHFTGSSTILNLLLSTHGFYFIIIIFLYYSIPFLTFFIITRSVKYERWYGKKKYIIFFANFYYFLFFLFHESHFLSLELFGTSKGCVIRKKRNRAHANGFADIRKCEPRLVFECARRT